MRHMKWKDERPILVGDRVVFKRNNKTEIGEVNRVFYNQIIGKPMIEIDRFNGLFDEKDVQEENIRPLKTLPYTTPTNFTYRKPNTRQELMNLVVNYLQGELESWADEECMDNPFLFPVIQRFMWSELVNEQVHLVNYGGFMLSSGKTSQMKIDCDALSDIDIEAISKIAHKYLLAEFGEVVSIPRGGDRLATYMSAFVTEGCETTLIVDDVYTTGKSMEEARAKVGGSCIGLVIFARGETPHWVESLFQVNGLIEEGDAWDSRAVKNNAVCGKCNKPLKSTDR